MMTTRQVYPRSVRIPPIQGLMALEAVARHASFSRAADELSITQSAVSHRISQLESILGVPLVVRPNQPVRLTPRALEVLPDLREALGRLRSGIARLTGTPEKIVRLTLAPAIASNWLIPRLTSFQRMHPDIDLDITVTSDMLGIHSGAADVGVRFGAGDWAGLDAVRLVPAKVFPVCSPAYRRAHPWLRTPADLARATLLRQRVMPWRPWFEAAGLDWPEPAAGPFFSEMSLPIDAAGFSQGVALALDVLVEHRLAEGDLVKLFDIELVSTRGYYVVTAKGHAMRPEAQTLVEWLCTVAGTGAGGPDHG